MSFSHTKNVCSLLHVMNSLDSNYKLSFFALDMGFDIDLTRNAHPQQLGSDYATSDVLLGHFEGCHYSITW